MSEKIPLDESNKDPIKAAEEAAARLKDKKELLFGSGLKPEAEKSPVAGETKINSQEPESVDKLNEKKSEKEAERLAELEKIREDIKNAYGPGKPEKTKAPRKARKKKEELLPEEFELASRDEKQKAEAQKEAQKLEAERLRQKKIEDEALFEQLRKEKNPDIELVEAANRGEKKGEILEKSREYILEEMREKFARTDLKNADILKIIKKENASDLFGQIKANDIEIVLKFGKHELAWSEKIKELMNLDELNKYDAASARRYKFIEVLRNGGIAIDEGQKIYKDIIDYEQQKQEYKQALSGVRAKEYEKAVEEIERLEMPEEKKQELLRQKMEDIVKTTVVAEANNLYDEKMRISLESKGDAKFYEKAWKTAGRAAEWYRKLPLKYKLAFSGVMFGGAIATGGLSLIGMAPLVGGATASAIGGGVLAGRWVQRIFGGAGTSVGLEGLIQRSQEKSAEKKTFRQFGENLSELIKNNDKKLDERLLELEGKKKGEKTRRYIYAGVAGGLVMSGLAGRIFRWGAAETGAGKSIKESVAGLWEKFGFGKPSVGVRMPGDFGKAPEILSSQGPGYATETPAVPDFPSYEAPPSPDYPSYEAPPVEEFPGYDVPRGGAELAEKGDSVWKIINRQLSDRLGEKFNGLDEARKTYIIDALKDKVAEDPAKFGLTNADQIQIGKSYDFLPGSKMEIDKVLENADTLKSSQMESILEHNKTINDWVAAHPGEKLPTERIDEILFGKKLPSVSEMGSYEDTIDAERTEGPIENKSLYENMPEEEPPGEIVSEKVELPEGETIEDLSSKPEIMQEENSLLPETESRIREIMAYNESAHIGAIGFNKGEYAAIKNFKIGRLLELIPSRDQAWEIWRGSDSLKLGASEFKKQIHLAELIRSYSPDVWVKEMTVSEFLQRFGPNKIT